MTQPPRITVVRGEPRLCCPCGHGFLGQLPVQSSIEHRDRSLSISWFCKSCNRTTTALFALGDATWSHEPASSRQESPL